MSSLGSFHISFSKLFGLFCPFLGLEGGHQALEYLAWWLVADGGEVLGADLTGQLPDLVPNPAGDIHRVHIFTSDEIGSVYLPTQLERTLQLYW
jgi:hypothetical protein